MRFDQFHSLVEGLFLPFHPESPLARGIKQVLKTVGGEDWKIQGYKDGQKVSVEKDDGDTKHGKSVEHDDSQFSLQDPFSVKMWLQRPAASATAKIITLKKPTNKCVIAVVPRTVADYEGQALKVLKPQAEAIHTSVVDPTAVPPDEFQNPRDAVGKTQFKIVEPYPGTSNYVLVWPRGTDISDAI